MTMAAWMAECQVLEGVRLVRARGMGADFRRHSHGSILVGIVCRGWRHLCLTDEACLISAGSGFILPAGCVHRCVLSEDHRYRVVCICLQRWGALLGEVPASVVCAAPGTPLLRAMRQLIAGLHGDPRDLVFETHLLALQASLSLMPGPSEPDHSAPDRMQKLRAWLEAHCAEPVRLATLAELAGCSPSRVNRVFSQSFGLPPHEYLMQQRLGLAARQLRESEEALVDLAIRLGFADQSHFQRFFKRAFGVTPGAYREASRRFTSMPG